MPKTHADGRVTNASEPEPAAAEQSAPTPELAGQLTWGGELGVESAPAAEPAPEPEPDKPTDKPRTMSSRRRKNT